MTRATIAGGVAGLVLLAGMVLLRGFDPGPAAGAQAKGDAKKGLGKATPAGTTVRKESTKVTVVGPAPVKEPGKLTTVGTATVKVQPNAARLFLAVLSQAGTIKDARFDNNQRVRKVMAALTALKIAGLKTKTTDVGVHIGCGKAEGERLSPIIGYRVTTEFTVLVPNEDRAKLGASVARVLDTALESGVNSLQQITFLRTEGLADVRRKALTRAVQDALANARALAAGIRKDRLEVAAIDGAPEYADSRGSISYANVSNIAIPRGGADEGALVIGDLEITCRVKVVCHY